MNKFVSHKLKDKFKVFLEKGNQVLKIKIFKLEKMQLVKKMIKNSKIILIKLNFQRI